MSPNLAPGQTSLERIEAAISRMQQKHAFFRVDRSSPEFPPELTAIEELRERAARTVKALEAKAAKAQLKVDTQKQQASSAKLSAAVSIGTSLLGAFLGRKGGLGSIMKGSTVTTASRVMREGQEAAAAEAELVALHQEMEELNKTVEYETQKLRDQYDPTTIALDTFKLTPTKTRIQSDAIGILWLPHERVGGELRRAWA